MSHSFSTLQGQVIRKAVTRATTALTRCRVGGQFFTAEELAEAEEKLNAESSHPHLHGHVHDPSGNAFPQSDSNKLQRLQMSTLRHSMTGNSPRRASTTLPGPRGSVAGGRNTNAGMLQGQRASFTGVPGVRARQVAEQSRPNTVGAGGGITLAGQTPSCESRVQTGMRSSVDRTALHRALIKKSVPLSCSSSA